LFTGKNIMKKILEEAGSAFAPLMTKKEIALIQKTIIDNSKDIEIVVELGTYAGGTTIAMSEVIPEKAKIITIDIFAINGSSIREATIENLKKYKNVELWEMSTKQAAQLFDKAIDFLFVDADHQDDSILHDLTNWLPKVRRGGLVCFDDYDNDDFPNVSRRVEEQTSAWPIIGTADTIMIKRKP